MRLRQAVRQAKANESDKQKQAKARKGKQRKNMRAKANVRGCVRVENSGFGWRSQGVEAARNKILTCRHVGGLRRREREGELCFLFKEDTFSRHFSGGFIYIGRERMGGEWQETP